MPPVVWALVLPMIALELLLTAGDHGLVGGPQAIGWRSQAVQIMAYSPDFMRAMLAEEVPQAFLDDHRTWVDRLVQMARTTVFIGSGVLILVFVAMVLTVINLDDDGHPV